MPADFIENITDYTLEATVLIAVDKQLGLMKGGNEKSYRLKELTRKFFEITFELDHCPNIWRIYKTKGFYKSMKVYKELAEIINEYVYEAVERYEKNPLSSDREMSVLEKLLKVDKDVAIVMAQDLILGGVDSTSTALIAVLYCLAKNPEKQEILRKEILTILPEKDSKVNELSFNNAPYLKACIKEALRLLPPVTGNIRRTSQDLVLQGYQVPEGVRSEESLIDEFHT